MLTYGPGNMFYRPTRTVYSHLFSGEHFYLALILIKGYLSRSDIFRYFFLCQFLLKNRKLTRLPLLDFKIGGRPIMANNDKNGVFKNTHFLLAHSGINRMKAF